MVSHQNRELFVSLVGAGLALSLIGCGDPNRTSGVVHLDGVPIRKGQLIFTPEEGLRTYVDIRKGKYETFSGEPLTPGQNTVMLRNIRRQRPTNGNDAPTDDNRTLFRRS